MSRYPSSGSQPSWTAPGLPSNPDMRRAYPTPPSDAFAPSSSSSSSAAAAAPPRRPQRSQRRPHGHQATNSIPSVSELNNGRRSSSPVNGEDAGHGGGGQRRPTWDEEREEREHAASLPSSTGPSASGSDIFRAAQVGKAFASAVQEHKDSHQQQQQGRRKQVATMIDPDLEGDFGGQFKGIDNILGQIRSEYPVVMSSEFNSISLALAMLESDRSSLYAFEDLSEALLTSLQSTVQTHSASFASSISTHNTFLTSLSQAQHDVRNTRAMLIETKESLRGEKRAEINALSSRSRAVKDMMDVLDTIDQLKAVPEQLETLLTEKRLLLAALVLVRSQKTLNKPALREVGALADLRSYFATQEIVIRDILLEELHNHIYLKSYYCEDRWVPYSRGQTKLQDPAPPNGAMTERSMSSQTDNASISSSAVDGQNGPSPSALSDKPAALSRYLEQLAMRPSQDPLLDLPDDLDLTSPAFATPAHASGGLNGLSSIASFASVGGGASGGKAFNPEANSFVYIEHLLEALAVLGRLGWALDAVAQRESVEVFALVESTIQEVDQRTVDRRRQTMMNLFPTTASFLPPPPSAAGDAANDGTAEMVATPLTGTAAGKLDEDAETLRDLFWTLYSKLDAVLQGFRVMTDVASRIGARKDFKDNSYSMLRNGSGADVGDLWKPVQAEVNGLLREYLTSNNPAALAARNPIASVNDILRGGKAQQRDRSKNLFRFNDSDPKATKRTLKKHDDELSRALRSSLPGLASGLTDNAGGDRGATAFSALDDKAEGASGAHRLLVSPEAHLVSVVFGPTLAFLARASTILPINLESENFGLETYVKAAYETPVMSNGG